MREEPINNQLTTQDTNNTAGREIPSGHTAATAYLWRHMRGLYGKRWIREYTETDEAGTWGALLSGYHPDQIKGAIAATLKQHPDHPPSMGQFRALLDMQPNPNAPRRLPAPQQSDQEVGREWLAHISGMLDERAEHYRREPMTDAERAKHWETLELDREKKPGYFPAGHQGACRNGCGRPGVFAFPGGVHWFCGHCYPGELTYRPGKAPQPQEGGQGELLP